MNNSIVELLYNVEVTEVDSLDMVWVSKHDSCCR